MGITRDVVKPVQAYTGIFHTSSTVSLLAATTTNHCVVNASTFYGIVVDRRELGANFETVDLCLTLMTTAGSTEGANPKAITLATWLMAGASSGQGDAAAVTPPVTLVNPTFYTTLDTTDMNKASTWLMAGKLGLGSQTSTMFLPPGLGTVQTFDLKGAGRYLTQAFSITRAVPTTCVDKLENAWVQATMIFRDADQLLPGKLALFSTSTTTST